LIEEKEFVLEIMKKVTEFNLKMCEIEKKEEKYEYVKTKTKVYINLGEPELAEKYKDLKCDGVGLMRAEFMASEVGRHPKLLIKRGGDDLFINTFAKGIEKVAKAFYPRPIVYRALDFKTNEYADLAGGKRFEPHENNPMIGWRGASRYITEPETFELELKAIKKVRDKGYDNVYLMIPFVRTTWELDEIKKIIDKVGLSKDKKFKLWIMVEVPSAAILIEEFCKKGIDGVSIGSNDLTQLILGVDRDSAILGKKWFNELDPAVLWAIERVVKTCKKYRVTCSICGQAPSVYPELTKMLVKWGVTSVSVNPDVVDKTRHVVAEAEKGLLHKLLKK
jgi:pyruvate,water dikinase